MSTLFLWFSHWIEVGGSEEIREKVKRVIEIIAGEQGTEAYLSKRRLRGLRDRALRPNANGKLDPSNLAKLVRYLRIPLEMLIDTALPPWTCWQPGSTIVMVTGMQRFAIPEQTKGIPRWAIDERDARAQEHLSNWLRQEMGLNYQWERKSLPAEHPEDQTTTYLEELRNRRDVGAIVVLGSSVVNPAAEPLARMILHDMKPAQLPARMFWGFELPGRTPFLSHPEVVARDQEGILLRGQEETKYRRITNADAFARTQAGDSGPFDDCGILLVDCRKRPLLVLCAGHGGCGTLACVHALTEYVYIANRLAKSQDNCKPWHVPKDRAFEVVWVKRTKPSEECVDDFTFDEEMGKGWGFWPK